jgi:hypothetical protein
MAYGKVRVDQVQSSTRTVDVDSLATTAVATQSVAGLLSATDKTKLDGVATGAEVNVNADWSAGSGDAQILNKPTLGTAAAKNTGTASGNVVELDGSARLPAVDGSQLTGINAATDLTYTAATRVLASSTGTDATLTLVTSSDAGLAPASGGGTTNFLRADGTWAAAGSPPAGSNTQIQFNDSSAFGGDADLTWNKTTNVLGITGDVNLSDGGTYTTTLQTITPTAARTISFPDATGTVALVGGSSGQLLWNNAGAVGGASTLTYDGSILTTSGRFINSYNATASSPAKAFTGTWFTGGTATTTKPQVLIEPTGTTSTAWSTAGTALGVNASSGFAGNLLDLQVNGTSALRATNSGALLRPHGSGAALSDSWAIRNPTSNQGVGFYAAGWIVLSNNTSDANGAASIGITSELVKLCSAHSIQWNSTNTVFAGSSDLALFRDAANTLAQRNAANAQTFRCYGTFTDASNYVRAALSSSSTAVTLAAETAGTGADNIPLNLTAAGTGTIKVNSVAEVVVSSTVAGLPAAPVVGMLTRVTDATAPVVGTTVAGGGAAAALCWYNGASWSVIGV